MQNVEASGMPKSQNMKPTRDRLATVFAVSAIVFSLVGATFFLTFSIRLVAAFSLAALLLFFWFDGGRSKDTEGPDEGR